MSGYLFNKAEQKPATRTLDELLGNTLGNLCSELFVHTAEEFGGKESFRANWLWDGINQSWYWVIAKNNTDVYTIYPMKNSLICHFHFKNSVEADNMGYFAWQYVFDEETLDKTVETLTYAVKTLF